MIRFALLVVLAACNGQNGDDTGDDTGECTSDCDSDGYTVEEGDCNDNNAAVNPGATEIWYDNFDQNCDDVNDDDQDADGEEAEVRGGDDCNDTDASIHPDATEVWYDGVDQDCEGDSDFDQDGDGHDAVAHSGDDCDDTKADVHPDADELCSTEYDDDCEGGANEADAVDAPTWYEDLDEDTYGNAQETLVQCTQPEGYVDNDDDCNDDADIGAAAYPGADDVVCDGLDNDCDPLTFETFAYLVNGVTGVGPIATAVGAAVDGDVISVCEGKHAISDMTIDEGITFEGLGEPSVTIIEPPEIDVNPSPTATLMRGAPILKVDTIDPVEVRNISLTKSGGWHVGSDKRNGGGLFVGPGGNVTVTDVVISGNSSGHGSGVYAGAGAHLILTRVEVRDNIGVTFLGSPYEKGGGFYLEDDVTIEGEDIVVDGNEAVLGGGFYVNMGGDIDCTGIVSDNDAELEGGGLLMMDGSSVAGLTVDGNSAIAGGGINASENTVRAENITITDVTLTGNYGSISGGGLWAAGVVNLDGVVFDGNGARYGGNLHVLGGTTDVTLTGGAVLNGLLTGTLHDGGGAWVQDANLQSIGVDWGVGTDDNAREDLWLEQGSGGSGGLSCTYGADATWEVKDQMGATCPP